MVGLGGFAAGGFGGFGFNAVWVLVDYVNVLDALVGLLYVVLGIVVVGLLLGF